MKNYFAAILCLAFLVMAYGCTSLMDERNVRTIAGDTKIKVLILDAFIQDDTVKTFDIDVACYYGHVYLIGEYDAEKQKTGLLKLPEILKG